MFELTKHRVRQINYRWFSFKESVIYRAFESLYQYEPEIFSWIVPNPVQPGFLLTNFICPAFELYRGKEIAFFDSRRVCVFWLPGATHSGGGYVYSGNYEILIKGYSLKHNLKIKISKNTNDTIINSIMPINRAKKTLKGGFISFSVIEMEIKSLILYWLSIINGRIDTHSLSAENEKITECLKLLSCLPDIAICDASSMTLKKLNGA